jgi:hypothetical protein
MPNEDAMKLKLDDQGHAVLNDGLPVYTHDDGKEAPFDAAATVNAIKARNAENKQHRERAEAAESRLKLFEGLDVEQARDAIAKLEKLDHKKLIDAGEVDRVKAEITKLWESKLGEAEKRAGTLEQQLHGEIVGGNFARSKFIAEKLAIPTDMVQAYFGAHFKVQDGKLKATGFDGNPLLSPKTMGEPASFDEALELLIGSYPNRDAILKSTQAAGSGAPSGASHSGSATLTKAQFDAMTPKQRAEAFVDKGAQLSN